LHFFLVHFPGITGQEQHKMCGSAISWIIELKFFSYEIGD